MNKALLNNNFSDYFNYYISLVDSTENHTKILENVHLKTVELLKNTSNEQGNYAYDTGKWSVKELLNHLIDTERIFCNRALRFARNDSTELPGYDHDDYVINSHANKRSFAEIMDEFDLVRKGTIALFNSFTQEMLSKEGSANGNILSVLAIGYVIAGHETHHVNILKERYSYYNEDAKREL